MNRILKKTFTFSTLVLTGMYAANSYIDACLSPAIPSKNNLKYTWKDIKINYSEKGNENKQVLLLIHQLHPAFSKEEWCQIDHLLAENFHIYEFDLPGCGKSDKPNITYINYLFVQLLADFIKDVIKEKANVCASTFSTSLTLMAARMYPNMIDKIIIINPTSIDEIVKPVTRQSEFQKRILELPIVGTFLYNWRMCKTSIRNDYKYVYYYNDQNIRDKVIDISYYNAHYKNSCGRYLLGSIYGNYTNINIIHALKKINNEIYMIGNGNYKSIIQAYKKYNDNIHTLYVSNCRLLPHMEIYQTITEKINSIF